jgi:diguanylate cyclase (GGDEF)-like protein
MNLSILQTLGIVDCAILKRVDHNRFVINDSAGGWVNILFPETSHGETIHIDSNLIFLHDFLIDAENFWARNEPSQIKSGIWTEEIGRHTLYLEAFASCVEDENFLVIRNAEQMYHERKQTLQIARELTISNHEVIERHDYLNERLQSILSEVNLNQDKLPLQEAIRYASIGIIIVNAELTVLEINPVAFEVFDTNLHLDQQELFNALRELVTRQYPEKAMFNTNKSWQGEVYLHMPPMPDKWLSVNINPVFSNLGKVSHWIISVSDQTRIKHLLQANESLALHDPLTGLPNRQYFWNQLQECISANNDFYLVSIDIVNFKFVNELYGYLQGDDLLKQIANRLAKALASNDFITRIGADEFMIIRSKNASNLRVNQLTFEQDALVFADKLQDICLQAFYTSENKRCDLAIKIGLTQYPNDANKAEVLLNNCDLALGYAKSQTTTSIQVYNDELKAVSERRLMLENALKNAIEDEQLCLYLQPILDMKTQQVVKAEALLRWSYNGEMIMPDEFIPIAESSNLINVIGRWVISKACEIARDLDSSIPLSINFSPNQIYDLNLISFIRSNMEQMQIQPGLIELEITEGILVNNYEKMNKFLHEIKQQGMTVSVDDFGTGYSSLSYLKNLPIDTLKIDRTFISEIGNTEGNTLENSSAIVTAIIALAQELKLNIIAEGIETLEQQHFLLEHNCVTAQGFLYSKPLKVPDFIEQYVTNRSKQIS